MDSLPWNQFGIGSGWALVALFVWLIYSGRLTPKSTLDRSEHEANEWRTESRIKDQQLLEKDIQLRHMEEVGRLVDRIMRSIGRNARSSDRQSRDEDE